jgi:hypothetical protein
MFGGLGAREGELSSFALFKAVRVCALPGALTGRAF